MVGHTVSCSLVGLFPLFFYSLPVGLPTPNIAASISGTVLDKDGGPLVGSTVQLIGTTNGSVLATATTNATGGYRFDLLSSGNYTVMVVPPVGNAVDNATVSIAANTTTVVEPMLAGEIPCRWLAGWGSSMLS